jgi:ketosteroid isomerase-like protein
VIVLVEEAQEMYKATVRALMRHSIKKLSSGDYSLMLKMADPNFELAFPGQNSWSTMFRPQELGRQAHATHRGLDEATAFADRFVAEGIQFQIEDILVNGPPWKTRIALRVHNFIPGSNGAGDEYCNRAVLFLEVRWGRLVRWEDYEDTQRVAAWDRSKAATTTIEDGSS